MTDPVVPKRMHPPDPPVLSVDCTVPLPRNLTLRMVTFPASTRITRDPAGAESSGHELGSLASRCRRRAEGSTSPSKYTSLSGL